MRKILLALIVCLLLAGCVQQPTVNYKDSVAQLNSIQAVNTKFNFTMHNPNFFPLGGKIDYAVFVQGNEFFTGQSDNIDAAANAETGFTLEQNIEFAKVFGSADALAKAVLSGQKTIPVRVAGQCSLRALLFLEAPIKIDQTVDVPLPDIANFQKGVQQNIQKEIDKNLNNIIEDIFKKL